MSLFSSICSSSSSVFISSASGLIIAVSSTSGGCSILSSLLFNSFTIWTSSLTFWVSFYMFYVVLPSSSSSFLSVSGNAIFSRNFLLVLYWIDYLSSCSGYGSGGYLTTGSCSWGLGCSIWGFSTFIECFLVVFDSSSGNWSSSLFCIPFFLPLNFLKNFWVTDFFKVSMFLSSLLAVVFVIASANISSIILVPVSFFSYFLMSSCFSS